ncbi:histidine utilization repressor [Azospirillum thermophilum]|uniref:Histidine utilization repressor n=1 Tax=Azospirillum thermophilum TaxID=2202148 RepID=A0A2S2CY39_9PROT|nr:histidine utilization repressor [Azospirillum thermophilum]AWK89401.1 histidine utilization repressor [Azospirillum thermophilum]
MSALPAAASPLYEKVKSYILGNISSGDWPADRRIPSENELSAALGISRMTINRALRELSDAGVLVRVQGVGTFIAAPKAQSDLLEINNIAEEIARRGHRHRAEVVTLERIPLPPDLRLSFESGDVTEVFHSVVVHYENDLAVQLEERFVNPLLVPDYGAQDFGRMTTYDYLVSVTPITELEHVISAISADAAIAAHLHIAPGAPCLLLHRRTWSGDRVATVNRLIYAGDRYALGSRRKTGR